MQINTENYPRLIQLTKIESVKDRYPSCHVGINIKTADLETHFNHDIWLAKTDIEKFLSKLKHLDEIRNGKRYWKV